MTKNGILYQLKNLKIYGKKTKQRRQKIGSFGAKY
jgi:hypothetical protein